MSGVHVDLSSLDAEQREVLAALQEIVTRYSEDGKLYADSVRGLLLARDPMAYGREFASRFFIGDVRRNAFRCMACDTYVESVNRHDLASCPCGNFTDGGTHYVRRGGDLGQMEDLSERWPWSSRDSVTG